MEESITARRFTAPLSLDIPRHWLPDNEVVSSLLNAYTILVPANVVDQTRLTIMSADLPLKGMVGF